VSRISWIPTPQEKARTTGRIRNQARVVSQLAGPENFSHFPATHANLFMTNFTGHHPALDSSTQMEPQYAKILLSSKPLVLPPMMATIKLVSCFILQKKNGDDEEFHRIYGTLFEGIANFSSKVTAESYSYLFRQLRQT